MKTLQPQSLAPAPPAEGKKFLPRGIEWLLLLMGGIGFYFMGDGIRAAWIVRNWKATPCTIVARNPALGRPGAVFQYQVNGRWYESERFRHSTLLTPGRQYTGALARRYPIGTSAVCYVYTRKPQFAVIERGLKPGMVLAMFPLGIALLGLTVVAVHLLDRIPSSKGVPAAKRAPTESFLSSSGVGPAAFCTAVLLPFAAPELWFFLHGGRGFEIFDSLFLAATVVCVLWLLIVIAVSLECRTWRRPDYEAGSTLRS